MPAPIRTDERGPKSLNDHVLSMQRDYGNSAVHGLVVQRKPKRRTLGAASTDMKDVTKIKPDKAAKKAPAEATFWPTANEKFAKVTDLKPITDGAMQWANATDRNSMLLGTEYNEEAFLRTKALMWADILWKLYKRLGDKSREAFWLKVKTRQITMP